MSFVKSETCICWIFVWSVKSSYVAVLQVDFIIHQSCFKNELIKIHYKYSCLSKDDINKAVFGEFIE